jgi:hypothetical protein
VTALEQAIAAAIWPGPSLVRAGPPLISAWPRPPSAWRSWTTASTPAPITSKNASRIRPSSASIASNTRCSSNAASTAGTGCRAPAGDVTTLKQQLLAQSLPPEQLVSIVVRNLNTLADVRAAAVKKNATATPTSMASPPIWKPRTKWSSCCGRC